MNGGTLSADLAISGPLDKLVISGPVRMSNTKLAGFDIGAKLGALSAFSGKAPANPDTTIQNASLNARIAPEMTRADAINVTIPSLGEVTGSGTISPNGALDFQMVADLQTGEDSRARWRREPAGAATGEECPSEFKGRHPTQALFPTSGVWLLALQRGRYSNLSLA